MSLAIRLVSFFVLFAACGASWSQGYPSKPVRIIVPNAPGTAPDVAARMVSERLTKTLGQNVVVENNTAGSGIVAAQQAAKATPDGHTLFLGSSSALVTNPNIFKSVPYDTLKDFTPIAHLAETAYMLAVNPQVPAKNVAEWIALAKAQPGKLSYAVDAGIAAIVAAWFNKVAGIDALLVTYKGLAPQVQDVVSGRVEMILVSAVAIDSFVKAGKLRPIGLTSHGRFPGMESIPAVEETLRGFEVAGWFILAGPAGIPEPIVRKLNAEIDAFVKEPEVQERFRAFGFNYKGAASPAQLREFVKTELERWGRITREAGVEPK
jgi:tripartite-type tricarboxylate transporter receptor subunit TctC